jgi:hypothetical protein
MKNTTEVKQILDKIDMEIRNLEFMLNTAQENGLYKNKYKEWRAELKGMAWIRDSILHEVFQEIKKDLVESN